MNLIVTACQVPFIGGGARYHIDGLCRALREQGHAVELLRVPFQFEPAGSVRSAMRFCEELDLTRPNGQRVDRVISLQFPGYAAHHPQHVVWLMHQYRAAYELFDADTADPEHAVLREEIKAFDERALGRVARCFANSPRVAERLRHYNGLEAKPLYHPPPLAEHYRCADQQPYVFYPSRLESLKRQDLLIRAAARLRSPVGIVIAGDGGQADRYARLIAELGVGNRVRLLGQISEAEKLALYASALGVFFGPHDEDYGYVTLEAMLSSKPVITCRDAGGPLAFVEEGVTGHVLDPDPGAIAETIDALHDDRQRAAAMGRRGRAAYEALGLDWQQTTERLLSA